MGSATATRCSASTEVQRFVRALPVALALACLLPSVAAAQRVGGELRLGGGWDSDPELATDPGTRRLPQVRGGRPPRPGAPSRDDGVFRVGGFLGAEVGDDLLVGSARLDLDGRAFGSGDAVFWERLRLAATLRLDPVAPRCALDGSRLDTGVSEDSSWTLEGSCGATLTLPLGFRIDADAWGGARAFDQSQLDTLVGGDASVGWTFAPIAIEVGFSVVRRESDDNDARRTELSPRAVVRLFHELVGGELGYRLVDREFDVSSRSGVEHTGRLVLWANPLPWLGPYVELELGYAEGNPQALSYERVEVVGGVRASLDWRAEPSALPPDEASGPVTVRDGRARFRFELDAEQVSVVGDFNRWDAAAGRLERGAHGVFEGSFEVEPGRHRYHLLVDGEPRRPPGAERYVADDFGGQDAVFEVPEAR